MNVKFLKCKLVMLLLLIIVLIVYESSWEMLSINIPFAIFSQSSLQYKANTNNKFNVLLICHHRGGSSFLFDLMSGYPLTNRMFEPLHSTSMKVSEITNKVDLIHSIFTCNKYPNLNFSHTFYRNKMMNKFKLESSPEIVDSLVEKWVCNNALVNLVKTIRFRMSEALELLKRPIEGRKLKIVYMVRDPRAIFLSRLSVQKKKAMTTVVTTCDDILKDIKAYKDIKEKYPNQVILIRYEDLAKNPDSVFNNLINFTGFNPQNILKDHVKRYTSGLQNNTTNKRYGTHKNSKIIYKQWISKIKEDIVMKIQKSCSGVLAKLGYNFFNAKNKYTIKKFNPVGFFNNSAL